MGLHKDAILNDAHYPHTWEYPTSVERLAATGFVATDVKKQALQLDTNALYILTATNPVWAPVGVAGVGSGTVTSASVVAANGVSGTVATATTTPAITISLGAITPTSVNSVALSGTATPTLAVAGASSISGSNTGDQTSITGNAGTATSLSAGLGGQVLYQSSAGVTAYLGNGTAGQVLQSNGTTVAPSWAALGGAGDMILAAVQSVTGAKTFGNSTLLLAGSTSGALTLKAPAIAATYVSTLPAATTTLAGLGVNQAWTKAQVVTPVQLSIAANAVAVDLSLSNNFTLALQATTSQVLSNPTNAIAGQSGSIFITQNATPSTITYGANWYEDTTGTAAAVSTTAAAQNTLHYKVFDATHIYYVLNKHGVL